MNRKIVFALVSIISLTSFIVYEYQKHLSLEQEAIIHIQESSARYSIEVNKEMERVTSSLLSIGKLIHKDSIRKFELFCYPHFNRIKYLNALELAPEGIIKHMHPLEDHFKIVNYNILKDASQSDYVAYSIESRKPHFFGPIQLKQGGTAIICRQPIFNNNAFKGFSIALLDIQGLFNQIGYLNEYSSHYSLSVSDTPIDTTDYCSNHEVAKTNNHLYTTCCLNHDSFLGHIEVLIDGVTWLGFTTAVMIGFNFLLSRTKAI